jgi:hypothetical protein
VLQHGFATRGVSGSPSDVEDLPHAARLELAAPLTAAAGSTFAWALVLTALTFIPAVLLPRRSPAVAAGGEVALSGAGGT